MLSNPSCANLLTMPPALSPENPGQTLRLRLDIFDESIIRTTFINGQPAGYDELSPLDVARALADVAPAGGWLPQDTVFLRPGLEYRIVIRLIETIWGVRLDDGKMFVIPLPPLLFYGRGKSYYLYALAEENWPTAKTELYHAPFPNVHPDGCICPGSVQFPDCGPDTIHQAADLFFKSAFNHDLDNGKSRACPGSIIEQWRRLDRADARAWPLADLIPHHLTLAEVLR